MMVIPAAIIPDTVALDEPVGFTLGTGVGVFVMASGGWDTCGVTPVGPD